MDYAVNSIPGNRIATALVRTGGVFWMDAWVPGRLVTTLFEMGAFCLCVCVCVARLIMSIRR